MCFERVKGELFQALFFNNIVGGAIAAWVGFKEVMKDVGDVGGGRRCSSPGHGYGRDGWKDFYVPTSGSIYWALIWVPN